LDLENPNKIVRIEVIDKHAGISVFKHSEFFNVERIVTTEGGKKPSPFRRTLEGIHAQYRSADVGADISSSGNLKSLSLRQE